MEKISIIVPCRNEERYIADFLYSVINNDYPKEFLELIIVDGKSIDKTLKIINEFIDRFKFIKFLINEHKTAPSALNIGIKMSSGDYIIRLDAHSKIPENYFSILIKWAKKLNADNTGTIWQTDVKIKTPKSIAIKKVLSNKFGVGNSYFRIGSDKVIEVDTVPFGCFKKEVFSKIGLFNEKLIRDQDIELNKRIKSSGGKVFLIPHIYSTYFARETYYGLAANNFSTGLWNVLTLYITKNIFSLSLRHFIPLFFLLSLILPSLLISFFPFLGFITLASIISYTVLIITISIKLNDKTTSSFYLILAFFVLHFSYGFGSLVALFRLDYLFKKNEITYL